MGKKLTYGIIMCIVGIFLNELAYIFDIWFIRVLIRILSTAVWTVGLVLSARAIDYRSKQKKDKQSS